MIVSMKTLLFCTALLFSSAVLADELADADALFAKKAYPEALQKYTKLANAGNVMAQQHLGEMYFYGEAGVEDMAQAAVWFRKAAAKGNPVALATLDLMKQRDARRADLDYWIVKYDGSDLRSGDYRCPAPRFPAMSKINEDIDRYGAKMDAWQECHNRFVRYLNASMPLTKRIPEDVSKLMTGSELTRANAHLDAVGKQVSEDTQVTAKLVLADFAAWRTATEAYVSEHNQMVKNAPPPEPKETR
jgi:TPR repeat protein